MSVSTALVVDHSSTFGEFRQLVENLMETDGDLLRCKTCGKTARNKGNMERHVEIHIEGLSFECQFCDKTYKTRMSRDQHKKLKHPFESCTFATDKEGMKGGVAAEHLKLDHSISGDMIKKAEKGSYKFKKVKEEN